MRDLAFNHLVWQESISDPGLPTPSMCTQAAMLPGRGNPPNTLPFFEVVWERRTALLPSARTVCGAEARGLGCRFHARNEFNPLLGVRHTLENLTMALKEARLVSHLSTALSLNVMFLKCHVCLGKKPICAFCQLEAGYGMIIRSQVVLEEPLGPLGTVSGTGPTCPLASRGLASARLCAGQHLPCHLQLLLWVRPGSSTRQDSDVTDSTCFQAGVDPSSRDTQGRQW